MGKKGEGSAVVVEELPRTIVRRIVKEKLSRLSSSSFSSSYRIKGRSGAEGEGEREADGVNVHKDALLAFSESARIFIHYLSATANDICKESKRQIINAEDVFKGLEEIEFPEFVEPLRVSLEDFRRRNASKKLGSKSMDRKRKMEEEMPAMNGGDDREDVEEEGNDDED